MAKHIEDNLTRASISKRNNNLSIKLKCLNHKKNQHVSKNQN